MESHPHHKILYAGIVGALLLIGVGVFYYLVIFLPHETTLSAQQEQAALQREQMADQAAAATSRSRTAQI